MSGLDPNSLMTPGPARTLKFHVTGYAYPTYGPS